MDESFIDPFEHYPHHGRVRLGHIGKGTAKPEYGLRLYKLTLWRWCGFCHRDLVGNSDLWRNLQVDEAVPVSVAKAFEFSSDFYEDAFNRVLVCPACNAFGNRYQLIPSSNWVPPQTDEDFAALRYAIFRERWELVRRLNPADEELWGKWKSVSST